MTRAAGNSERSSASGASDRVEGSRATNASISQSIGKSDVHLFHGANETARNTVSSQFDKKSDGTPHPFEIADNSKRSKRSETKSKDPEIKGEKTPDDQRPWWENEHRIPKTDEVAAWQQAERAKKAPPAKTDPTPPSDNTPEVNAGAQRILKALTPASN